MKRTSFADVSCPVARTLNLIGEWWTLLILRDVFYGVRRFDKLLSSLGIARNVLTDRLNTLVESGILEKQIYQQKPERYEYHLTESGRELLPVLVILMNWGNRWLATDTKASVELVHEPCGQAVASLLVCRHCSKQITTRNVRLHNLEDDLQSLQLTTKSKKRRTHLIET